MPGLYTYPRFIWKISWKLGQIKYGINKNNLMSHVEGLIRNLQLQMVWTKPLKYQSLAVNLCPLVLLPHLSSMKTLVLVLEF